MNDGQEDRREGERRSEDQHRDALAQNVAALAAVVEATARNVNALTGEVRAMRKVIVPRSAIRKEAAEIGRQRRRSAVAVALFAVALIWAHDEHVEHCSPGARAVVAVETLINADPQDENVRDDIVAAVKGDEQSKGCDVTFPLHDHDSNGWPGPYNVLGMVLWTSAAVGAYFWTRGPRARLVTAPDVTTEEAKESS